MARMTTHRRNWRHATAGAESRTYPWPLLLIAAPAAVAIWSGWVGLGGMCGFGPVNLLPGIGGGFHVNTAITLPVGVEAYGTYGLKVWLNPGTPDGARAWARRSALGALILGALGQVIYHLLAAAGAVRAPWPVVVLVSCMPVATVAFAAALWHLTHAGTPAMEGAVADATLEVMPEVTPEPPVQVTPEPVSSQVPEPVSGQAPEVTSSDVSGQPEVTIPVAPKVKPRRKVAARPARISDAALKEEIRAEFRANPSVSVNAAAKALGRSRDRVRPLLEQVRREAGILSIDQRRAGHG